MQRQLEKLRAAQERALERERLAKKQRDKAIAKVRENANKRVQEERARADDRVRRFRQRTRTLNEKIKDLEWQLKSGETAQTEGLLAEGALHAFLKEHFPNDGFEHTGKGGDILHAVMSHDGQKAGLILYEVKRVATWSNAHVKQCADACAHRKANVAILVTNRFPAKRKHYFVDRGVLVISPLAVLPLVHTAREGLLTIYELSASGDDKKKAATALYDFLAGGEYVTHMRRVGEHLQDLHSLLQQERKSHEKNWDRRDQHHRGLLEGVSVIHNRLRGLLVAARDGNASLPPSAKALLPKIPRRAATTEENIRAASSVREWRPNVIAFYTLSVKITDASREMVGGAVTVRAGPRTSGMPWVRADILHVLGAQLPVLFHDVATVPATHQLLRLGAIWPRRMSFFTIPTIACKASIPGHSAASDAVSKVTP